MEEKTIDPRQGHNPHEKQYPPFAPVPATTLAIQGKEVCEDGFLARWYIVLSAMRRIEF